MTKERLEELIKQRAIIYYASEYTAIELDFDNVIAEVCGNTLYCQNGFRFCIKDLFETEEQALWALRTVAERIERFEPPMWDEIEDGYFFPFFEKTKEEYICWSFEVVKGNCVNAGITIFDEFREHLKFNEPATKENYEKACEMVRDLFKGENNG